MKYDCNQYDYTLAGSQPTIDKGKSILDGLGLFDAHENLCYQVGKNPDDKELLDHAKELGQRFKNYHENKTINQ